MNNSLAKGTVYITIATIIFVFSSYLINIILGRVLGPAEYGVYGVIITLMTTINLTQTSGLPLAVAKFVSADEKNADSVLKSGLILQSLSTILATLFFLTLAIPLANLLNDPKLIPYIQLSAAVFPLYGIYSIYTNYYNGLHKFKIQAIMNIVYSLTKLFSVLILVYFFQVYGAIVGFILSPLTAILFWTHIPKVSIKHFPYKKLIYFSLPLIGLAIFSTLLQSIDLLFTKSLLQSNTNTGFYNAAQNISKIPFYCVTALASVLYPSISRSISQNTEERTHKLIFNATRITLILTVPIVLLISATSNGLMELFYSSSYMPGAQALSILVIGIGFFTLFTILTTIITSSGSPYKAFWYSVIGVVLTSILCIYFIPIYGINGAALATTLSLLIITILAGVAVHKKFRVSINLLSAFKITIASSVVYILALFINIPFMLLPFAYIIFFAVYLGILYLLRELKETDIELAKSILPKQLRK